MSKLPNFLEPSDRLPLSKKRIVVTAPRNYAARLATAIIQQGGLPVIMPTIETCVLENFIELDAALDKIETFDWIAFTSRHGIEAFFQRMNDLNLPDSTLQNCHFCAIGKDADRLSDFTGRVEIIPDNPSPAGIINELSKIPEIQGQSILVPVPEVRGIPEPNIIPNFVTGLQKLAMNVTRVPTYITRCLPPENYLVELDLIRHRKIAAIAFSSTGEVQGFLSMMNSPADYQHCAIACFGPYTAGNARNLGLSVNIVAKNYSSFTGFAEAIATYFQGNGV
jgi:uroporphyrinogen-III synthase